MPPAGSTRGKRKNFATRPRRGPRRWPALSGVGRCQWCGARPGSARLHVATRHAPSYGCDLWALIVARSRPRSLSSSSAAEGQRAEAVRSQPSYPRQLLWRNLSTCPIQNSGQVAAEFPLPQRRSQRCSVFDPSASEPPAVQCSVVEEHARGMVHLHGVIIATRDITGQFDLQVMKTGPGGIANLSQAGTFSAPANRKVTVGQSTISVEPGAEYTASLEVKAGGRTYKCRAGGERT